MSGKDLDIAARLRKAGVPATAYRTTLHKEGFDDLRQWAGDGGIVDGEPRGLIIYPANKSVKTSYYRRIFYLCAKETLLAGYAARCMTPFQIVDYFGDAYIDPASDDPFWGMDALFVSDFYDDDIGIGLDGNNTMARFSFIIRWCIQEGMPVSIMSSTDPHRIENVSLLKLIAENGIYRSIEEQEKSEGGGDE